MIRGEKVERFAALARLADIDPLDTTELVIALVIGDAFDVDQHEAAVLATARKISAALLDLGWQMPGQPVDQ